MKNRIAEVREQKGIMQKELAEMVGISVFYLNKIENHKATCSVKVMLKIKDVLGVKFDDIFFED